MNSAHDLGGMHGFGPVVVEPEEPVFHEEWERSAFAVFLAAIAQGLTGSSDANRHAIERMGNVRYLTSSYYEHWVAGTTTLLIENGVLTREELDARIAAVRTAFDRYALPPAEGPDRLSELLRARVVRGVPTLREVPCEPRFRVGDAVATTRRNPEGHTRLPRYARGRRGTIVAYHGPHVFPDTNAHGLGECPEPLYGVRFEARELFGDDADERSAVHLDLWESYLMPAEAGA